jgi:excisionase family DNA binding protein
VEKLLSTEEVAELLGRSPSTVRYLDMRGEGPRSFKIGRRRAYDQADVDAWIAAQKAKADADRGRVA